MKISTDSGCLISIEEAKEENITIIPLQIAVGDKNYRDYMEISSEDFVELIKNKAAYSSQPAVGEVMEAFESGEETLHIAMAKGLSAAYDAASSVVKSMDLHNVTVFNSTTLAGPQQYLVHLAIKMRDGKNSIVEIVDRMQTCLKECDSFLIPVDFNFLKRGGRLTPMAATLSGLLKMKPILTVSANRERLEKFTVGRTWGGAIASIADEMKKRGINAKHKIYISHAFNFDIAKQEMAAIMAKIQDADIEILKLTPAMITQGGPGCLAIQYILKDEA
ncbi:MAG: DegV family protein [Erysipelotrichales bacterium]|nr:MAG: DegV family protein [Erysipelotrichales bacterium]